MNELMDEIKKRDKKFFEQNEKRKNERKREEKFSMSKENLAILDKIGVGLNVPNTITR